MSQSITEIQPNIIIGKDLDSWIELPAWKGFQSRKGAYGLKDSNEGCDGIISTHVVGTNADYVYILSQGQFNAIQYLSKNSERVRDSLLNSLLEDIPNAKEIYEEHLPDIASIEDYKNHIGLSLVHVMDREKEGFAYYGFELGCSWDGEHGIGVMMHKDRVVELGLADVSFSPWAANENKESSNQAQGDVRAFIKSSEVKKKKWWKFWK